MAESVETTLARIEERLINVLASHKQFEDSTTKRLDNYSGRISTLERWQSRTLGAFGVVTFLVGAGAVWKLVIK